MKTAFAVLAMSVACTIGGCTNDGSPNMFTQDFWKHDPNAVATKDTEIRHDKRPTQYQTVARDDTTVVYSETYVSRPAGQPNDATSGTVMNDTQLQSGNDKTRMTVSLNSQDQQFLLEAAGGGLYEVQSSQKALAKSTDANVKNIAQHMVDDHTKSNAALSALAQRKGVPTASLLPNSAQIQMLVKLDSLTGTEFDREYLIQQRQSHIDALAKFQAEANNGFDRDIRDFASATLPTVRGHLDMINGQTNLGNER